MSTLEKYFGDEAASEALRNAEHDPSAAWDALVSAAGYLERNQPLPGNLANHLARAINKASFAPMTQRVRVLTDLLYLTASNRARSFDRLQAALDAYDEIKRGATQENSFANLGEKYGVSSESIKGAFRECRVAIEDFYKKVDSQ